MEVRQGRRTKRVRSAFVSDVHLGCRHSQGDAFLEYLNCIQVEHLYLVGDFLDGWKLRRSFRWEPVCDRILARIADLAVAGTRLFYLPGNHDAFLRRDPIAHLLNGFSPKIEIADELVHCTAAGQRFLVTHGDLFDRVEVRAQWLSRWSSLVYDPLLSLNRWLSRRRRNDNRSPYAFCAEVKGRVKKVVRFLSRFEGRLLDHARDRACSGVICGHIHTPAIVHRDGMLYCNTGDWVENCTSLEEDDQGRLSLHYFYPQVAAGISIRSAAQPSCQLALRLPGQPVSRAAEMNVF